MDITANRPSPTARRFEAGTPAVVNCYAVEAGLKIILEVGTDVIEERVRYLTAVVPGPACRKSTGSITPRAGRTPRSDGLRTVAQTRCALFAQADGAGYRHLVPRHNLRATFHFYNSEEDIDTFVQALKATGRSFTLAVSRPPQLPLGPAA